jgi:23S rRNA (pseudouridine1915-N3)-methyltransferase
LRARILFPHRLKNEPIRTLVEHYLKLANRHIQVDWEVVQYSDRKGRVPPRLISRMRDEQAIFLSERGLFVSSYWFREELESVGQKGGSLLLVIGDAEGLPQPLEAACHRSIALSQLTLPHELALVVIAEQLWRAASMIVGHPYHK